MIISASNNIRRLLSHNKGEMEYFCNVLTLCVCLNFITAHPNPQLVVDTFTKPYRNDQFLADFFRIIKTGNVRKVQEMLGKWDINAANEDLVAAIHIAATQGNEEMANLLMQRGSHVDLQTVDGLTPLHYAANNGNFAFSEALIKHGATVDALDHNLVTPLQLAVFNDDSRLASLLIKHGANVNHIDKDGKSVLHWAASKASDKTVKLLLQNGVKDVSLQDHTGKTPLYYAAMTGNSKFQEVLKHFLVFGTAATLQLNIGLFFAFSVCLMATLL